MCVEFKLSEMSITATISVQMNHMLSSADMLSVLHKISRL